MLSYCSVKRSRQERVSLTSARVTLTNGIVSDTNLPLYWNPWFTVCTIIPLNFNACLGDMEDFADLWPLFILWQVYCDYITHFNFRFSPVRRTLRWFILSPSWSLICLPCRLHSSFPSCINLMNRSMYSCVDDRPCKLHAYMYSL